MRKKLEILGHLIFLVLIILSIVFYKHRILNYDTSYQLTKIINNEFFNIEAARFSTIITQIIPLIGIYLGLELQWILILFSVSFVLVYYLVYLIVVYGLKKKELGILIPIVLIWNVKDNFFYTVTETHQALVYAVLFHAWLNKDFKINIYKEYFLSFLIICLCFFSHPVSFFLMIFSILYTLIDKKDGVKAHYLILLFFIFSISFLRFLIGKLYPNINPYETSLFNNIDQVASVLKTFFSNYTFNFLIKRLNSLYIFLMFTFCIVLIYLALKHEILKLIFLLTYCIGFIFITVVIYYNGDADVQMEKDYMPLTFFIFIPFLKIYEETQNKIHWDWIKLAYLFAGFCWYFYGIYQIYSTHYQLKYLYLESLVSYGIKNKQSSNKFIVNKSNAADAQFVYWPLATETLLLSALANKENTVTFFYCDFHDVNLFNKDSTLFYNASFWEPWLIKNLNKNYFYLYGNYQKFYIKDFYINDHNHLIICDAEKKINNHLICNHNTLVENSYYQSDEKSYSGKYSLKLSKDQLNAFYTKIPAKNLSFLKVGAWIHQNHDNAKLVIHSNKIENYYIEKTETTFTDSLNQWKYLTTIILIPSQNLSNDTLILYLKNNSDEIVYCDDWLVTY